MHINVTLKGLTIPPLLSTAWSNILSLSMDGTVLQVKMNDSSVINIPNLTSDQISLIFERHEKFLGTDFPEPSAKKSFRMEIAPLNAEGKLGFMAFDELGGMLQHDPNQPDMEELPSYVLEKMHLVAQSLPPFAMELIPQPVLGCNCLHCQITRAILSGQGKSNQLEITVDEPVSDDELQFSEWAIVQTDDKMYTVTSQFSPGEEYHVFLGKPIGCTCGNDKCEHIAAVLKT